MENRGTRHQSISLFVRNLDDCVDDARLRKEFSTFGKVIYAKVMTNLGKSKGFGFVTFPTIEQATLAMTEMNGRFIGSLPLYVAIAQPKPQSRENREAFITANLNTIEPGPSSEFFELANPTAPFYQEHAEFAQSNIESSWLDITPVRFGDPAGISTYTESTNAYRDEFSPPNEFETINEPESVIDPQAYGVYFDTEHRSPNMHIFPHNGQNIIIADGNHIVTNSTINQQPSFIYNHPPELLNSYEFAVAGPHITQTVENNTVPWLIGNQERFQLNEHDMMMTAENNYMARPIVDEELLNMYGFSVAELSLLGTNGYSNIPWHVTYQPNLPEFSLGGQNMAAGSAQRPSVEEQLFMQGYSLAEEQGITENVGNNTIPWSMINPNSPPITDVNSLIMQEFSLDAGQFTETTANSPILRPPIINQGAAPNQDVMVTTENSTIPGFMTYEKPQEMENVLAEQGIIMDAGTSTLLKSLINQEPSSEPSNMQQFKVAGKGVMMAAGNLTLPRTVTDQQPSNIKVFPLVAQGLVSTAGNRNVTFQFTSNVRNAPQGYFYWQQVTTPTQLTERVEEPEKLTEDMLATVPPQERREMLGERLYPLVHGMYAGLAGKITGMLLELDNKKLLHMLEHVGCLRDKVDEAVAVLIAHEAKKP